jgi:nucleolar complex protein 3
LKEAPSSKLLSPVLRGIAKFGHQINVEFFPDLMAALRTVIAQNHEQLSPLDSLNCVITAFSLLSGHGELLNLDLKEHFDSGYKLLLDLPTRLAMCRSENTESLHRLEMPAARQIRRMIDLMFCKRNIKTISAVRAAAFVKRLAILSTQFSSPNATLTTLGTMKALLMVSPTQVHQMLDAEKDRVGGTGRYLPECDQPDLCHPFNATLWELEMLHRHWHPSVRDWIRRESRELRTLIK